jgi:putative ABC transport system permease protein
MRYALRMMRKSPAFTAVAVVTLALGIGANTAIFSVVNALVLQPLPIKDPSRIVAVTASSAVRNVRDYVLSLASYETLRDQSRLLSDVAAYCGDSLILTGADVPEQLPTARVSPNFFDLMGTRPMLGRGFESTEGGAGGRPVALISYRLWQRRFASDRSIVGQSIPLDQEMYTVIGVLPAEYPFPFPGADVWITRLSKYGGLQPEQIAHGAGFLRPWARLASGVSLASAGEETQAIHVRYKQEHPRAPDGNADSRLSVTPLRESITVGIRQTLMILTGAVGFVLLIACANVAALLLARATSRGKEIALRAALGASRWQLVSLLLWESLLLSGAGAALGVALADWGVTWLVKADAGNNLPGFQPIGVNWMALLFTAVISVITGVAFGLIPALQVSRPDLNGVLREGGRGNTGGQRRGLRSVMVIAQIGLSIVLLIGAGLLIESFRQVQNLKLGFDPTHTLTARLTLPPGRYPDGPMRKEFVHGVMRRLENLPGMTAVAVSQSVPMTSTVLSPILAEGQPVVPLGQRPLAQWNGAAPGYFRTVGVPLISGRDFTWADDEKAPRVVVVNQALAHYFWPGENPLGKHITFTRYQTPFEVVGVVGDTRSGSLEAAPRMTVYSSYGQWTWQRLTVSVRTPGNPMAFARVLAAQVAAVDRDLALVNVQSMEEVVAGAMLQRRETTYLIAGFAVLALVLAVIGLYGVMSYSVAQRTAEIGIRQAIGAHASDILWMVIGQGLRLSLAGIVLGALAAAALTRLMDRMLFQVSATDPKTYIAIAAIFLTVGCAASFVPAWRATRIDPLEALRVR